jgi:hypothetical protein
MSASKEFGRKKLIQRARALRDEISQMFTDVDHWNRCVRAVDEEEINPDPNGELTKLRASLNRMLAHENQRTATPKARSSRTAGNRS